MLTRPEQKEKRRAEIMECALDQFIRRGYIGTKIKDIAQAAGMSVGLLFHYFESKEALYTELIKLGVSGPRSMVGALPSMEPLAFFELLAQRTLAVTAESTFTAKMFVLMGDANYTEGTPEEARKLASGLNFYLEMTPLIILGQQNGSIREGDPLALCTTFWTALQGAIGAYALNPDSPLPEAAWIVDIIRVK